MRLVITPGKFAGQRVEIVHVTNDSRNGRLGLEPAPSVGPDEFRRDLVDSGIAALEAQGDGGIHPRGIAAR